MEIKLEKKILILGTGGHAKVITDIAKSLGFRDFYYQDKKNIKNNFLEKNIIKEEITNYCGYFFVAIGNNFVREKVSINFQKKNPNARAALLIHPSSYVSENCSIGRGTVVMPLSVINSYSKIGEGVIINTRSSIDHDNYLMDFSSVAPGVTTGGNVTIGYRSAISIGAAIKNNIEIGSDSIIGGQSYVNKNISNNLVVYGSPSKVIRTRKASENYL